MTLLVCSHNMIVQFLGSMIMVLMDVRMNGFLSNRQGAV